MESSLVSEFREKTNCDLEEAYIFLRSNNWDLKSALELWTERQNAISPKHVEMAAAKKLSRGISRASTNTNYVCEARKKILCDRENNPFISVEDHYINTYGATFLLPDFTIYPIEFQSYLENDLIDLATQRNLEASLRLNWWTDKLSSAMKLYPLSTTGDGNCLLHSISLSMFGFHDRLLFLRQLEHEFITDCPIMEALKRRWKFNVHKTNVAVDVIYTEEEWEREWNQIVNIASTKRRAEEQQSTYESLEEIHILVLAHMLRRVIIVISETMLRDYTNQPFAPITIGGIYIPYECDSRACNKTPLLISYDLAHFSSLVFMDCNPDNFYMVPLTDHKEQLLPVQFSEDVGLDFDWCDKSAVENVSVPFEDQVSLLKEYLEVIDLSNCVDDDSEDDPENSASKAAKQLQNIGKQFGSIGKSMGKKLRRNFGSLTRLGSSSKAKKTEEVGGKFLVALVNIKKFPYHEEMTNNYLACAQEKFLKEYLQRFNDDKDCKEFIDQALSEGIIKCTRNAECNHVATILTSYLCQSCFEAEKEQYSNSQFGIGKSKFYRETDIDSYRATRNIPVILPARKCDKTLYLSNSTFFNDSGKNSETDFDMSSVEKRMSRLSVDSSESTNMKIPMEVDVPR